MKLLMPILFIALCLSGCDKQRVFEMNRELDNAFWLADSAKSFTFSIGDTTQTYNILCNLRNSAGYPFQNIYIDYVLSDTTGSQLAGELVNRDLFDPKTGKPLGSGLGDVSDHQFSLLEKYTFPQKGDYTLSLKQYMRRDTLPDIVAIGVRVEKTEDN